MHPLAGSNFTTLIKVLLEAGPIPPRHWPQLAGIVAAVVGRLPFTWAERALVRRRLAEAEAMPGPIFIVGHWRSGTTHLYNIMSKGEFGYVPPVATGMPWDLLILTRLIRPILERALPEHRFIDNVPVHPDSPQEDEIALANMTSLSFYHGIYFPRRFEHHLRRGVFFEGCGARDIEEWTRTFLYFLKKLYLDQGRRRLIIKNPVYTARLKLLHQVLPTAKFIHINRNPYEVFESMRNFYRKLFLKLALQPYDHVAIDNVILETYGRMMTELKQDAALLPRASYIELRYEVFEARPIEEIERIFDRLQLDGFARMKPAFERYLATVTAFQKNKYPYTEEAAKLVEKNWGAFLDAGGWRRPARHRSAG